VGNGSTISMAKTPQNNRKVILKLGQENIRTKMAEACTDYQKNLKKFAFYKTHNQALSDDLVQATFLKALLYLQKGGNIETMRVFLNHVMRDLIIDEYRKHKNTSLDTLLEVGFDPCFDDTEKTIDVFDGKAIVRLIDDLPKKYRLVMQMKYLQDLSLSEIAVLTGQTKNTVAVQLYRGLRKLQQLVVADQEDFFRQLDDKKLKK
jgi:RNA polymerase sigma-70 factor (ECF subfamily)